MSNTFGLYIFLLIQSFSSNSEIRSDTSNFATPMTYIQGKSNASRGCNILIYLELYDTQFIFYIDVLVPISYPNIYISYTSQNIKGSSRIWVGHNSIRIVVDMGGTM